MAEKHACCEENAEYVIPVQDYHVKIQELTEFFEDPYGSTEGTRIDGTGVSALLTWDSKVTTVDALLGGVQDLVRQGLKKEGLYKEFIKITEREHSRVFRDLKGEDIDLCLPKDSVPDRGLVDFTKCS